MSGKDTKNNEQMSKFVNVLMCQLNSIRNFLHLFWHIDTQQRHAAFEDHGYHLGDAQTQSPQCRIVFLENRRCLVETVEILGQIKHVVGYQRGTVAFTGASTT